MTGESLVEAVALLMRERAELRHVLMSLATVARLDDVQAQRFELAMTAVIEASQSENELAKLLLATVRGEFDPGRPCLRIV